MGLRVRTAAPARLSPFVACFLLVACALTAHAVSFSAESVQAWRKRFAGAGLTVGLNPLNPNTVVAEGALGVLSISYDRGKTWQIWSTPPTSFIRQIIIHPSDTTIVFCASAGPALLRSTNFGASWSNVLTNFGIDGESIAYDPAHPDTMYAGNFADGNVFRSIDRGATWVLRGSTGPSGSANLCALTVRPDSANIVFAGSGGGRISKSTDFGLTWRLVKNGTAPPSVFQETPRIIVHPLTPHVAYATTYGDVDSTLDVWKTVDGGEHWFRTGLQRTPTWSLECDPTDSNSVYVGSFSNALAAVYKSTDGGGSWSAISAGLPSGGFMWNMKIHPSDPSVVWMSVTIGAFGPNGMYRLLSTSTLVKGVLLDAGSADTLANGTLHLLSTGDVASVSPLQREFRFGYFEGDPSLTSTLHIESYPYVLTDAPLSFVPDTETQQNISLQKLATHAIGGRLLDSMTLQPIRALVQLAVQRSIGDTLLTDSTDLSGNFQFTQQYVSAPPVNGYDRLTFDVPPPYATSSVSAITLSSTDLFYDVPLGHADVFLIAASDSGKYLSYYLNALQALHVTSNAWDVSRRGNAPLSSASKFGFKTVIFYTGDLAAPLSSAALDSLTSCLDGGGHLFLTGQNIAEYNSASQLFTSYLGVGFAGNTPTAFNQGVVGDFLQAFNCFTTGIGANNQTSRDSLLLLRPDVRRILDYGVGSGRAAGVRVDSAGAGSAIVLGFGFEAVHTAQKRQDLLQAVLDHFRGITEVGSHELPPLPSRTQLDQNYPNPFNPTTTIRFRIQTPAYASLRIYDLTGREVATLLDGRLHAGEYSVPWSADRMSSGVYYYRLLVTGDENGAALFSETRKLLLLR